MSFFANQSSLHLAYIWSAQSWLFTKNLKEFYKIKIRKMQLFLLLPANIF